MNSKRTITKASMGYSFQSFVTILLYWLVAGSVFKMKQ